MIIDYISAVTTPQTHLKKKKQLLVGLIQTLRVPN